MFYFVIPKVKLAIFFFYVDLRTKYSTVGIIILATTMLKMKRRQEIKKII